MTKKAPKSKAPVKKTAAKKAAPVVTTASKLEVRNGVTQPREGTACRAIWDACVALKTDRKDISFDVLRAAIDSKVADATIRMQRQRWKQYSALCASRGTAST